MNHIPSKSITRIAQHTWARWPWWKMAILLTNQAIGQDHYGRKTDNVPFYYMVRPLLRLEIISILRTVSCPCTIHYHFSNRPVKGMPGIAISKYFPVRFHPPIKSKQIYIQFYQKERTLPAAANCKPLPFSYEVQRIPCNILLSLFFFDNGPCIWIHKKLGNRSRYNMNRWNPTEGSQQNFTRSSTTNFNSLILLPNIHWWKFDGRIGLRVSFAGNDFL